MQWIDDLNRATAYIEAHLADEIDCGVLARMTCCSVYHFQRMFACIVGVPLAEYIRRRRMSLAAVDLQSHGARVTDIALRYGYDSPTAFNRAFQSVHGVAPSQAKMPGVALKAYPPISFQIAVKGDVAMNYRIETKQAFRIVGVSQPMPSQMEEAFAAVPQMWQKVGADGSIPKLLGLMNSQPMGILGVSVCMEDENWRYFIAVASESPAPEGMQEYTIPACTWAIFPGEGPMPHAIQEMSKRIMTEWLPTSGYEYANAPDIEVYLNEDTQNSRFEIWLPVVKKA